MRKFLAVLAVVLLAQGNAFGAWVMFSDGVDTYIYNNVNGDIFVRHKGEGKNYEDKFIKMPVGEIPPNLKNPQKNNKNSSDSANKSTLNSYNTQNLQDEKAQNEQLQAMQRRLQELESKLLDKALE